MTTGKADEPNLHLRGLVTNADLDAIHQHRVEAAEVDEVRGLLAFSHAIGAAPGLMVEFEKLKNRQRG
jgi:hypothetical protein